MTFSFLARLFGRAKKVAIDAHHAESKPVAVKTYLPRVGDECLSLIKHFESCLRPIGGGKYEAYPDAGYGWEVATIGWGTVEYENGKKVKKGDVISQERADELLQWEVWQKADAVKELVRVPIADHEFAALVSFAYNVGVGALKESTLLRKLNEGDREGAAREFTKWNKSNGKTLDGLTRRRMSEARLFRGEARFLVTMEEFKRIGKAV